MVDRSDFYGIIGIMPLHDRESWHATDLQRRTIPIAMTSGSAKTYVIHIRMFEPYLRRKRHTMFSRIFQSDQMQFVCVLVFSEGGEEGLITFTTLAPGHVEIAQVIAFDSFVQPTLRQVPE